MQMTGRERISNILKRKPVDRIGLFEHFWGDTQKIWAEHGHIKEKEDLATHFGFDMSTCWPFNYAHSLGLPVIVHSCGFIEPLVPGLIEAGMDCLQVIEIKAGMDLLRLKRNFGNKIAFCGGMDARNLVANDRAAIKRELEAKIPAVMKGSGYILHSDHSIPTNCEYETYRYFVDEGLRLGTYGA